MIGLATLAARARDFVPADMLDDGTALVVGVSCLLFGAVLILMTWAKNSLSPY